MFLIEMVLLASAVTIFLNYCIGKPASDFSPYEIFSSYTVWLSIRRLKEVGLYDQYSEQYHDNLQRVKTKYEVVSLKNDFKKMLYNAADPYFTWERAVGMCPVCTGFWISLIIAILATGNILHILEIVVFSHIIIRIANKLL
jgi:cobalamin biosynthesis Co2+ chelatase CbiK